MTHNYLSGGLPTAIITRKRNEMRSYNQNDDSIIYLNDKDTFEIRLFNPSQIKVGAEIRINGQTTSDGLLVLNPGQDVTIERYLDSNRKFMFETYHVDMNNPSAKKAIESNGLIEIFFYNEKVYTPINTYYCDTVTSRGFGGTLTTTCNTSFNDDGSTFNTDGNIGLGNSSSDYNLNVKGTKLSKGKRKRVKSAKVEETGRIGKGEKSNQKFEKVNVEFESYFFHNLEFKLLPASQRKTINSTENVRNYCSSCSYRLRKSSWEFCPHCGNEI